MLKKLSMIFTILINVKIPTIIGILKFVSMIKTAFESIKSLYFSAF